MSSIDVPVERGRFGHTARRDAWWVYPLFTFLGLAGFLVYSGWAAFQGNHYSYAGYLSPMYSPLIFGHPGEDAWFGEMPAWIPGFVTVAMLVLWMPGGFRITCYYYRGAYYKAFWADPLNCTVGEPRKTYLGERYFPLIIQNIHRYFMYLAVIFIFILGYDAWKAMWFADANGAHHFGIGIGTIVLTLNVVFLASYTFGCHSLRHLIGGFLDAPSRVPMCMKGYDYVSRLNRRHMMWAWISLFGVGFSDVYVRLC